MSVTLEPVHTEIAEEAEPTTEPIAEEIAEVEKLKNDKKFNNQIAKKSLRFVNKFTWSKVQKEYLKIT